MFNDLNTLAEVERLSGDSVTAEQHYREALDVALTLQNEKHVAIGKINLALLFLEQNNWVEAETLAREALVWSENVGSEGDIANCCHLLAEALVRLGNPSGALAYARRAVKLFNDRSDRSKTNSY